MKPSVVKCWRVTSAVCDFEQISTQEPELQLVKRSILKNGYRAYCLNDREEIEQKQWYKNYLEGDRGRFYIDGSGLYKIANIDLADSEFYFDRQHQFDFRQHRHITYKTPKQLKTNLKPIIIKTLESMGRLR